MQGSPAVFLDRDGTINVEKDYLYRIEDLVFIEGAEQSICRLQDANFKVVVVTNQSGIARKYYQREDVYLLHDHIQMLLRTEWHCSVDAFYFCPHHPEGEDASFRRKCSCRKGAPGMLLQAAEDLSIDLSRSWMVGDKAADIEAGQRAGCQTVLVQTGYGVEEDGKVPAQVPRAASLVEAVDLIMGVSA